MILSTTEEARTDRIVPRGANLPRCPICGAGTRRWDKRGGAFVWCLRCSVVFRDPMPDDDALRALYRSAYTEANIASCTTDMTSPRIATVRHAAFVGTFALAGSRILDFGAGTGGLVGEFQSRGYAVAGVESSEAAAAVAEVRTGAHIFRNLEAVLAAGHAAFDVVTAMEVVEHLANPHGALRDIRRILKPGGKLYVTTPNVRGLLGRLQRSAWREAQDLTHLMLYSFCALARVLEDAGFVRIVPVRFSPLTGESLASIVRHRMLQAVGLYGGLRVIAHVGTSAAGRGSVGTGIGSPPLVAKSAPGRGPGGSAISAVNPTGVRGSDGRRR